MAANLTGSPPHAAPDEPMFHNNVLTRTHEPARAHSSPWMVVIPVVVAVLAGVGVWAYAQSHPAPPAVSNAFSDPTTTSG